MKSIVSVALLLVHLIAPAVSQQQVGLDVPYDSATELCKVGETETGENVYGECIPEQHFPICETNKEFICYNRINRRDLFYEDKQPHYYIDPKRVLCYDLKVLQDGGGCATCTVGRYCMSEGRCIMDDENYDCDEWWNGGIETNV